jgi:hypothetical protein
MEFAEAGNICDALQSKILCAVLVNIFTYIMEFLQIFLLLTGFCSGKAIGGSGIVSGNQNDNLKELRID